MTIELIGVPDGVETAICAPEGKNVPPYGTHSDGEVVSLDLCKNGCPAGACRTFKGIFETSVVEGKVKKTLIARRVQPLIVNENGTY